MIRNKILIYQGGFENLSHPEAPKPKPEAPEGEAISLPSRTSGSVHKMINFAAVAEHSRSAAVEALETTAIEAPVPVAKALEATAIIINNITKALAA